MKSSPTTLATAILAFLSPSVIYAQGWSLTRITDSNQPVPGDSGIFTSVGTPPFQFPALGSDGRVAFRALYTSNGVREGIFSNSSGVLGVVANFNTLIPGATGNFGALNYDVSYDGTAPTFTGGVASYYGGVYSQVAGQLVRVVDFTTPLPGGGGTLGGVTGASRSGDRVTIARVSTPGLFQSNAGVLSQIADASTPAPGGGTFASFAYPVLSGNTLVFAGTTGSRSGIFKAELTGAPSISIVMDNQTPIPGGTGTFTGGFPFASSFDNVAFVGRDQQNRAGIYAHLNGQLVNIADTLHPGPQGRQFGAFYDVAISGDSIAFTAGATGFGTELWVWRTGVFSRVVGRGDVLNGLTVGLGGPTIFIGPESLKGDTVAFSFSETNIGPFPLRGGVYTATIPVPGTLSILAAAGILVSRRRR